MRLASAVFTVLFTLLTVPSFAQGAECEALARAVIAVAMNGKVDAKLVEAVQMEVLNQATASIETVECLTFTTGAAEIVVEALPSYYAKGICEIKSINVSRE